MLAIVINYISLKREVSRLFVNTIYHTDYQFVLIFVRGVYTFEIAFQVRMFQFYSRFEQYKMNQVPKTFSILVVKSQNCAVSPELFGKSKKFLQVNTVESWRSKEFYCKRKKIESKWSQMSKLCFYSVCLWFVLQMQFHNMMIQLQISQYFMIRMRFIPVKVKYHHRFERNAFVCHIIDAIRDIGKKLNTIIVHDLCMCVAMDLKRLNMQWIKNKCIEMTKMKFYNQYIIDNGHIHLF